MSARGLVALGTPVTKGPSAPAAVTGGTLFTVSGAVLVTALLGRVTTVIGGTAATITLGTAASATAICTATSIASLAAGVFLVPSSTSGVGGALVANSAPYVPASEFEVTPFIVGGNILQTISASNTGAIQWYLWYIPIDAGAAVS
jgi:hypothetical protein